MQLYSRNGASVELEGGTNRINFGGRSIHSSKDVELIVVQLNRNRIVGLKRGALCPQAGSRSREEQSPYEESVSAAIPSALISGRFEKCASYQGIPDK